MKPRALLLALLWVVSIAGAVTISAQVVQRVVPPGHVDQVQVLTGEDLGFRVEGHASGEGAVRGRFVVKVDGTWREIELMSRIRTVR